MIQPNLIRGAAALMLLAVGAAPPEPRTPPPAGQQMMVREQIIVRFHGQLRQSPLPLVRWKEGKGPKCIPARTIAGADAPEQGKVDLILRDGSRMRARLDSDCPALDYYYGFYITPNPDGRVCADRDIIRSRMGGQCGIDRFRKLKPRPLD